jgi:hypothetical protein
MKSKLMTIGGLLVAVAFVSAFTARGVLAIGEEIAGRVLKAGNHYDLIANSGEYMVVKGGQSIAGLSRETVAAEGKVTVTPMMNSISVCRPD